MQFYVNCHHKCNKSNCGIVYKFLWLFAVRMGGEMTNFPWLYKYLNRKNAVCDINLSCFIILFTLILKHKTAKNLDYCLRIQGQKAGLNRHSFYRKRALAP